MKKLVNKLIFQNIVIKIDLLNNNKLNILTIINLKYQNFKKYIIITYYYIKKDNNQ